MGLDEIRLLERKLPPHRPGELLARLRTPQDRVEGELPVDVLERFDLPNTRGAGDLVRLGLPAGMSTAAGLAWLEKDQRFEYVTTNDLRSAARVSDDYDPEQLWGMQKIQAPEAWEQTVGSTRGPVIAVLDTGVDLTHPDLRDNLWVNPGEIPGNGLDDDGNGVVDDVHGYDAVLQTGDPGDDDSHGSHCAGTVAARGDNGVGVVGVNWQAQLMPVKMMSKGEGSVADCVRAVAYATRMGARITSNSYGGGYNEAERDAFESSPLVHVCAAGNEGNDNDVSPFYPQDKPVGYPANYPFENIVAVAATNQKDRLAGFSNYGRKNVDLAAPGVSTLSTVPGGGYETKSGTSMATPHVAGVAGLIATLYPEASAEQIRTRLLANVDVLPGLTGKVASGGRLNAARALEKDELAPAAPGGLSARQDGPWLDLSWNASGDDGDQGQAYRYLVTQGERSWRGPAAAPGQPQSLRIPIGADAREVKVQIEDNVGNLGPAAALALNPQLRENELRWHSDGVWGELPNGVWADSPAGPYANHADTAITSDWIDLTQTTTPSLRFQARHRLESGADSVFLEVQRRGREDWQRLADYTSYREWEQHDLDLSALQGEVRFRFRLTSDGAKVEDGFYLDRAVVLSQA